MSNRSLYRQHLEALDLALKDAIARAGKKGLAVDAVLLHAGRASCYHRDDEEIVFVSTPHFRRYVPLNGPEHCVLARPGKKPLVVRVAPKDYWYEVAPVAPSYWQEEVELAEVESFSDVIKVTGPLNRTAYLGNSREAATELGIADELIEPEPLLAPLDWHRATKTAHEVALVEIAAERGAAGHLAAKQAFVAGQSERATHFAFLAGCGQLERELPFGTIVAFDEKSATLHYQNKRPDLSGRAHTFLCDAGASCDGYASDITRTWLRKDADPAFAALLHGLDALQRDLVSLVTRGRPYLDIHVETHRRIGAALAETKIVRCSAEEAFSSGVTRTFMPHGVGHHLGIQVHDIGGRQAAPEGGTIAPPTEYPSLRNTRPLEAGHLVTIEPGIYFVPMLLEALRAEPAGKNVDWKLVTHLTPLGGMRIEDDVLCTAAGPRDLTRGHIAGPRGM